MDKLDRRSVGSGNFRTGIRGQVCELAAARRAEGIGAADVKALGAAANHAVRHLRDLTEQGRLVRAEVPGQKLRWFSQREHMAAWLVQFPDAPAQRTKPAKRPHRAPGAGCVKTGVRADIVRLAASRPREGVTTADIVCMGIKHNHAGRHTADLVEQGRLFRAKLPMQKLLRWFATAQDRDAWIERKKLSVPKIESTHIRAGAAWTLNLPGSKAAAAKKAADAGVSISPKAGKLHGEVSYKDDWKFTVCPSPAVLGPAALVALPPGQTPFGAGFAAAGIGRYPVCDRVPVRRPVAGDVRA